jgi:hypothetical protein
MAGRAAPARAPPAPPRRGGGGGGGGAAARPPPSHAPPGGEGRVTPRRVRALGPLACRKRGPPAGGTGREARGGRCQSSLAPRGWGGQRLAAAQAGRTRLNASDGNAKPAPRLGHEPVAPAFSRNCRRPRWVEGGANGRQIRGHSLHSWRAAAAAPQGARRGLRLPRAAAGPVCASGAHARPPAPRARPPRRGMLSAPAHAGARGRPVWARRGASPHVLCPRQTLAPAPPRAALRPAARPRRPAARPRPRARPPPPAMAPAASAAFEAWGFESFADYRDSLRAAYREMSRRVVRRGGGCRVDGRGAARSGAAPCSAGLGARPQTPARAARPPQISPMETLEEAPDKTPLPRTLNWFKVGCGGGVACAARGPARGAAHGEGRASGPGRRAGGSVRLEPGPGARPAPANLARRPPLLRPPPAASWASASSSARVRPARAARRLVAGCA